ncbi:MAG TPA: FAD:protein FMN transferase [Gammaproteobacteria bacterium]
MGTWVDLAVVAAPRTAEAALDEAEAFLRRFEIDYYAWAPDGELARLNRALAELREATVSPEMAALLVAAKRANALSGGAFDPGVGALVERYGFHEAAGEPREPTPAEIDAWLGAGASIAAVDIDGVEVSARTPVLLDLGGIAKGAAVDRIVELFRRHGITSALVNAGGDLRVLGTRGDRAWRIGIQDPRADDVLGVIELADGEAAFTSGDYERYVERGGERLHHLLDPRTGRPADESRAVTVIARDGVAADSAATALFVAGDDWADVADALDVDAVLRVDSSGRIEATETMRRRLVAGTAEQWDVVADS